MTQNPNQFNQTNIKGGLDLQFPGGVISAAVAADQATAIVPGQAVVLDDEAGALPKVISLSGATVEAVGFAVRNLKDVEYTANDRIEVAIAGSVIYLEAGAAIARQARVEFVPAGAKVITSAGTNPIVGWALDKAASDGDLIRVYVTTPGETPAQ